MSIDFIRTVRAVCVRAAVAVSLLTVMSSHALAATKTWTGMASSLWSNGGNWTGGVPGSGDDLVFPSSASNKTNTNDIAAGTSFNSITFTGGGYTLSGNSIALGAGGITMSFATLVIATLNLDIVLGGPRTVSITNGNPVLVFGGSISGPASLTINGDPTFGGTVYLNGANGYSGGTTIAHVTVVAGNNFSFGTGMVTTDNDSTISMQGRTIANALTTQGAGHAGNAAVNGFGVWAGAVTLVASTGLGGASAGGLRFTGPIIGSVPLYAPQNSGDSVVVLSGDSPAFTGSLHIGQGTLYVNAAFANAGANLTDALLPPTLGGTGTIGGPVTTIFGVHLAPGFVGPGTLGTGSLSFASGATYDARLNANGYTQLNVTGTLTLAGTLTVSLGYVPPVGTQFIIINNDAADAVSGTFAGLPEGAHLTVGEAKFRISYVGGTGNDVVLTAGSAQSQFDFDGDFKTDPTVFRPSNNTWYQSLSNGGATATTFGASGDVDVAADYDGDGKTDIAVWRPSVGVWYIVYSSDQSVHTVSWGINGDIPIGGDVDGDGKADQVVFRPTAGAWFFKTAFTTTVLGWGVNGDQPLLGDFDRDGKLDATIYRPSNGVWYVALSNGGSMVVGWGTTNDVPVIGDWDGDGKSDPTIFRPSSGSWFVNKSTGGTLVAGWGVSGDVPVSGDFNNDGLSDFTVWRPTTGVWYTQYAGGGTAIVGWGTTGDKPLGRVPGS